MKNNNKKGFTLIELLVVIAIIGVLSAIGFAAFTGTRQKARNTRRVADMRQIGIAMETFQDANSTYAFPSASAGQCANGLPKYLDPAGTCATGTGSTGLKDQLPQMPTDPQSSTTACTVFGDCCTAAITTPPGYSFLSNSATAYTFSAQLEISGAATAGTANSYAPAGMVGNAKAIRVTQGGTVTVCNS